VEVTALRSVLRAYTSSFDGDDAVDAQALQVRNLVGQSRSVPFRH
jgi:hypothetical protein